MLSTNACCGSFTRYLMPNILKECQTILKYIVNLSALYVSEKYHDFQGS